MAGPVMHIVLALAILPFLPHHIDHDEFIAGTSFPDIRYYANLPRETTHVEPVSWEDIRNEPSSFRAGLLFHNFVDIMRILCIEPYFYNKLRPECCGMDSPRKRTYLSVLKFAEDATVYERVKETAWQNIIRIFDRVYQEERDLCPDENKIIHWHNSLQWYLKQCPTIQSGIDFLSMVNSRKFVDVTPELFDYQAEFNRLVNSDEFTQKVHRFVEKFYERIPQSPLETPWDYTGDFTGTCRITQRVQEIARGVHGAAPVYAVTR